MNTSEGWDEQSRPGDYEEQILSLWREFSSRFDTHDSCVNAVYEAACALGLVLCRYCGGCELAGNHGTRILRCLNCNRDTWFTAGTFFNRMRRPRAWLAAIWFMEHGIAISSSRLSKLAQISQSSALVILKKLAIVLEDHMDDGCSAVHSSLFADVICRRSRQTPASMHPRAEIDILNSDLDSNIAESSESNFGETNNDGSLYQSAYSGHVSSDYSQEANSSDNAYEGPEVGGLEKELYKLLSDEPISTEQLFNRVGVSISAVLASLVVLELEGFAVRLPGDRYVRSKSKKNCSLPLTNEDSRLRESLSAVSTFIKDNFHGISRKCLQSYLAAYWCYMDKIRWYCGGLLNSCLQFRSVTGTEVLNYVSPAMVKMVLLN